jgi:hypothetical protein
VDFDFVATPGAVWLDDHRAVPVVNEYFEAVRPTGDPRRRDLVGRLNGIDWNRLLVSLVELYGHVVGFARIASVTTRTERRSPTYLHAHR